VSVVKTNIFGNSWWWTEL